MHMPFTPKDKIRELEREIEMRRQVYGRKVRSGAMDRAQMQYRIDILKAIINDLRRLYGLLPLSVFDVIDNSSTKKGNDNEPSNPSP